MPEPMPELIQTDRLMLSPFTPNDTSAVLKMCSDATTMRFIGPVMANENDAYWQIARFTGHWVHHRRGAYAVRHPDRGVIGWAGLFCLPLFPTDECGWLIDPTASGLGFASEAAAAVVAAWKERAHDDASLVSFIHYENAASIRLAERIGAARVGVGRDSPYEPEVYSHTGPINEPWISQSRRPQPTPSAAQHAIARAKSIARRVVK